MGVADCSPGLSAKDGPYSLDSSRKIQSQFWVCFHQRNDSCSTKKYAIPCSAEVFVNHQPPLRLYHDCEGSLIGLQSL